MAWWCSLLLWRWQGGVSVQRLSPPMSLLELSSLAAALALPLARAGQSQCLALVRALPLTVREMRQTLQLRRTLAFVLYLRRARARRARGARH